MMSNKYAYIFAPEDFGVAPLFKLLGIDVCEGFSNLNISKTVMKILEKLHDKGFLIFSDSDDNIVLLEKLRVENSISSPAIILSFSDKTTVEKKFTPSPKTKQPIFHFGKGMYYLKMPFRIDNLRDILKEAKPLEKSEMKTMKVEYKFAKRYKTDAEFRHSCANFAGALRILQGAYYTGDVQKDKYLFALDSLKLLSWKKPEMRSYTDKIKQYIDDIKNYSADEVSYKTSSLEKNQKTGKETKILLLDDEAETGGWNIVLKTIFEGQGCSLAYETDRDKFIAKIENNDNLDFNILLLDLKMPDAPGRSVYIIDRMREKFPDKVVIVFTALNDIRQFDHCKRAGAFDYFVKDFGHSDRDPVAYYKKLKWLIGRANILSREIRQSEKRSAKIGDPAIYTCKISRYISLSRDNETMMVQEEWASFFAYKVDGFRISKERTDIEDKRGRLLSWLMRQPADGRGLNLRYICDPDRKILTIALIGKGAASSKENSIKIAKDMYRNISLLFKDFFTYNFTVVTDEKELLAFLEPFNPQEIATIHREKLLSNVKGQSVAAVYPFYFNERTYLNNLIEMLMGHDAPVIINIGLWPVDMKRDLEIYKQEIQKSNEMFELLNPKGEASVTVDSGGSRIRKYMPVMREDEVAADKHEEAFKLISTQLISLNDGALFSRFDIVSETDIPSMLIETLRYDFFGPNSRMAVKHHSKRDLPKVWRDSKLMQFQKPIRGYGMTDDLVDILQAKTIFQFAIPGGNGIIGIKSETNNFITITPDIEEDITQTDGILIANGFAKDKSIPVHLRPDDLMKHLYICGRTGSGKSTLLLKLAQSLILKGKGVCLMDPHGDVALTLLNLVPQNRRKDIIFFDPADPKCKEALNCLENDGTEEHMEQIYQEFMNIILKSYDSRTYIGPMFERLNKITFLTGMMAGISFDQLPSLWHDEKFLKSCLQRIDKSSQLAKELINFWENELPDMKKNPDYGGGIETYITSPIDRFVSYKAMKRSLAAQRSTFDFDDVLNSGKILIVRLPKGTLGEITAYSLGMFISFRLKGAIMRRGAIPEKERKDFYLIIDEFQNLLSSASMAYSNDDTAFTSLLSEARKFKVSMILANQFINQLGQNIRNAIFGNIQSKIFFGIGSEDAAYVTTQIPTGPGMDAYVTIPNFHAYAQLLVNGQQVGPFTIKTIVPE